MTLPQKQALKIWNAMIYEEPIPGYEDRVYYSPFSLLLEWFDIPTAYLNEEDTQDIHQIAAFLREVSDGLEEYHGK